MGNRSREEGQAATNHPAPGKNDCRVFSQELLCSRPQSARLPSAVFHSCYTTATCFCLLLEPTFLGTTMWAGARELHQEALRHQTSESQCGHAPALSLPGAVTSRLPRVRSLRTSVHNPFTVNSKMTQELAPQVERLLTTLFPNGVP